MLRSASGGLTMSHASDGQPEEGRLDLVPMIDCVMLLLLFFIMTSSFTAAERHIQALLGTGGSMPNPSVPPPTVRIAVLPGSDGVARIRIGGGEELRLDGVALTQRDPHLVEPELDRFHAAIAVRLATYEQTGPRTSQPAVEIHCATRLPWCLAMGVYDAVRAYELARLPVADLPIDQQRTVTFASPPMRNSNTDTVDAEQARLETL